MKRRSGMQMTFRLGQENDIYLFCVSYTLPYYYFFGMKCIKCKNTGMSVRAYGSRY